MSCRFVFLIQTYVNVVYVLVSITTNTYYVLVYDAHAVDAVVSVLFYVLSQYESRFHFLVS